MYWAAVIATTVGEKRCFQRSASVVLLHWHTVTPLCCCTAMTVSCCISTVAGLVVALATISIMLW